MRAGGARGRDRARSAQACRFRRRRISSRYSGSQTRRSRLILGSGAGAGRVFPGPPLRHGGRAGGGSPPGPFTPRPFTPRPFTRVCTGTIASFHRVFVLAPDWTGNGAWVGREAGAPAAILWRNWGRLAGPRRAGPAAGARRPRSRRSRGGKNLPQRHREPKKASPRRHEDTKKKKRGFSARPVLRSSGAAAAEGGTESFFLCVFVPSW